jgi:gamma-glutamyltranspeptidase/glutathione hydrolase
MNESRLERPAAPSLSTHDTSRRRLMGGALAAATLAAAPGLLGDPTRGVAQTAGGHVQAVVSAHGLATDAGVEVLDLGGTAADAAIAVATTLSVVEPWFSSALGGGTWALYYEAETGEVWSLDGVGPTGSKASIADYGARAESRGIHQANVPGAWDGWMLWLDRFARLDLGEVLAPAIRVARAGYEINAEMGTWLRNHGDFIRSFPASARLYAPDGEVLQTGDLVQQLDMAATFEALAQAYAGAAGATRAEAVRAARDYYYRGPLAAAIVAVSDEFGGYLTLEDFQTFAAEIVAPVSIAYRDGITVFQNPPNSQGMTQLLGLNTLKGLGLSEFGPDDPEAIHLQVEAIKLAFADRYAYIGDPDRVEIPVAELLSDQHADRQRSRIKPDAALRWPIDITFGRSAPAHTTTFHIVDRAGNAAAVTTSLGANFLVIGETGIHINNRMRMLSLEEGNANQLTPGSKVRHTSCPYMALRNGRPYILGGNTGVDTQPQGQLQQVVNVVEFGLGAQEAVDRPRFVSTAFPSTAFPWEVGNELLMEEGFPESVVDDLRARGHQVVVGDRTFGSANMIVVNADGTDAEVGAESRSSTAAGDVSRPGLNGAA